MAVSAVVKGSMTVTHTRSLDVAAASADIRPSFSVTFSDGAGANQVNLEWSDTRTITASLSEEIDLTGTTGSPAVTMTDIYGQTVSFARIKAILVTADSGNTNDVQVKRGASNGCALFLANGDGISVRPGGAFMWVAPDATGIAVSGGSTDILTITNSAGSTSVSYTITILGAAS
jgi:hypothetical protein